MVWHNGQTGGYSAFFALYSQARRVVAVLADTAKVHAQQRIALSLAHWMINTRDHDDKPSDHAD